MISRWFAIVLLISAVASGCGGGQSGAVAERPAGIAGDSTDGGGTLGISTGPAGSDDWPLFVYPRPGEPHADVTKQIQWTAANNSRAYELQLGTTVGGNDIYDSGIITTTSLPMPPLPSGTVIYARVRAILTGWGDELAAGHWPRGSYSRFRTDDDTPASTFMSPAPSAVLAAATPIEWSASSLATGYRLTVSGDSFVFFDSGVIHTTQVLIPLPTGLALTATLETIYLDRTVSAQVTFFAAGGAIPFSSRYALAKKVTAQVRLMADRDNQPLGGTPLDQIANSEGLSNASCWEFRLALVKLLTEAQAGIQMRESDIEFQEDQYSTHTLEEIYDPTTDRWITLDPTFGLITLRADGAPATTVEISAAVRALNWKALGFEFLTGENDLYARDYYIDYPLLFVDVASPDGNGLTQATPTTLSGYFIPMSLPIASPTAASYALLCPAQATSASVEADGVTQTLNCEAPDGFTHVFQGYNLQANSGSNSASVAWQLQRFIF